MPIVAFDWENVNLELSDNSIKDLEEEPKIPEIANQDVPMETVTLDLSKWQLGQKLGFYCRDKIVQSQENGQQVKVRGFFVIGSPDLTVVYGVYRQLWSPDEPNDGVHVFKVTEFPLMKFYDVDDKIKQQSPKKYSNSGSFKRIFQHTFLNKSTGSGSGSGSNG